MPSFACGQMRHIRPFSTPRTSQLRCFATSDHPSQQREQAQTSQPSFRIRQAKQADTDLVAALCAQVPSMQHLTSHTGSTSGAKSEAHSTASQVFGPTTFSGIAFFLVPSSVQVQKAATELRRDVNVQLTKSLKAKTDVSTPPTSNAFTDEELSAFEA